jgi:hypothetical protein
MNRKLLSRPTLKKALFRRALIHAACATAVASTEPTGAQSITAIPLSLQAPSGSVLPLRPSGMQATPSTIVNINDNGELSVNNSSFTVCIGYTAKPEQNSPPAGHTPMKTTSPMPPKGVYLRITLAF